ncbi:uncharacterized protein LOC118434160 [Folsomia candida]|nr:uncharacterized protein LOC118434160 [Folsomia candida]
MLAWLVIIFLGTLGAYIGFYILEPSGAGLRVCYTDIIMAPIITLAGTTLLIPTAILIFFLHALRIRLFHFNKFMETKLEAVTPSYSACSGYWDYGKEIENNEKSPQIDFGGAELSLHLEKLRLLYTEMGALSCEISQLFGSHLARDYLFSTVGIILYTYIILYVDYNNSVSNYAIVTILEGFLLLKLFMMSLFAQRIHCFVFQAKRMLNRVSIARVSPECGMQIQMFLNALDSSAVRVSAAGYFTIDRGLLTSLLGAITTYFIILIQFKVGDVKQELLSLTKSCILSNETIVNGLKDPIFPMPRFG